MGINAEATKGRKPLLLGIRVFRYFRILHQRIQPQISTELTLQLGEGVIFKHYAFDGDWIPFALFELFGHYRHDDNHLQRFVRLEPLDDPVGQIDHSDVLILDVDIVVC